jgi:hypothetical protein
MGKFAEGDRVRVRKDVGTTFKNKVGVVDGTFYKMDPNYPINVLLEHVDLEPNLDVDDPEEGWQDVPFAESELKKVEA